MKRTYRSYTKAFHDFMGAFGAQRLSTPAQSLLLCLLCQYNGKNNGSMKISTSVLPARWKSNDTRRKARSELLESHFIYEVKKGHRPKIASLYAIACFPLDHNPQHDPELAAQFSTEAWREHNGGNGSTPPDVTTLHRRTSQRDEKHYTAGRHYAAFTAPPDVTENVSTAPPAVTMGAKRLHRRASTFLDVYPSSSGSVKGNGKVTP